MKRRDFLAMSMGAAGGLLMARPAAGADATTAGGRRRPNVIIIYTDDQGYADLGCQDQVDDIETPHLDAMAADGVRCTHGYISAPQCSPSRAGLITGRYQQRFGLNHIPDCPMPADEVTVAERMLDAGYVTGMVGKWHLEPNILSVDWAKKRGLPLNEQGRVQVPQHEAMPYNPLGRGFSEYFKGEMQHYWRNYDLDGGNKHPTGAGETIDRYRLDVQTDGALAFIDRNHDRPFFLYLAYFAPHTPLEAPEKYLSRFPGDMPERRRYALAMMAAIDDGVGRIRERLADYGITEDTLIFFTSDNGAPLKMTKPDNPIGRDPGGWDGSLNTPWVGEKGMLAEGGIRVPFLACWPGTLPAGRVYEEPVIALDFAATAVAQAGLPVPEAMDGVDLTPYLSGEKAGPPHDALYWRFWNQTAVREGKWKYLQVGGAFEGLFDLSSPAHETENLIEAHPDIALRLQRKLAAWAADLEAPGVPDGTLNGQERNWYAHYFGVETGDG